MKRSYLLFITITILFSIISSNKAFAATGLSEAELAILVKLRAGAEINGEQKYLPSTYINQAENEFLSNEDDITEEQAAIIIKKVDEATDIINDMNIVDIANVQNSEAVFQLMTLVSEAASVVNYDVSINIADRSVSIRNKEGDTVFIAKDIVNQTGYSINPITVGVVIYFTVLIFCVIAFLMLRINISKEMHYPSKKYNGIGSLGRI